MKTIKATLVGAAALALCATAGASVAGSLGGGGNTFLALSSAGLAGGAVATLSGGTVYTADEAFHQHPQGHGHRLPRRRRRPGRRTRDAHLLDAR